MSAGRNHVRLMMLWLVQGAGEGLVLRKPKMMYEPGRSHDIVKFKTHRDDEAMVMAAEPPSFTLVLPSGATFSAISANEKKDIKAGEVVTFIASSVTPTGIPINAKITRVRHEFSWEEFVASHKLENQMSVQTPSENKRGISPGITNKNEKGYWTREEGKEVYAFFDTFSKQRGFDPLVADNWYSVTTTEIRKEGGGGILHHFKGSIVSALMHTYPFIGLSKSKFKAHPKYHWHSYENRKQFFEELATENGTDSSNANDWYKLNQAMLAIKKGGTTLVQTYGSIERLLKDVYPHLNLEASKFISTPYNYWKEAANRKAFFDAFAKKRNFDPLVAQNWYSVIHRDIIREKGANGLFGYFGGSFVQAVSNTYTDIGLNIEDFKNLPQGFWKDPLNRKNFFTKFARKRNFDPSQKENWYSVSKLDVMLEKGGIAILRFYSSSVVSALMDVYPDIDFNESKKWMYPHRRACRSEGGSLFGDQARLPKPSCTIHPTITKLTSCVSAFGCCNAIMDPEFKVRLSIHVFHYSISALSMSAEDLVSRGRR